MAKTNVNFRIDTGLLDRLDAFTKGKFGPSRTDLMVALMEIALPVLEARIADGQSIAGAIEEMASAAKAEAEAIQSATKAAPTKVKPRKDAA